MTKMTDENRIETLKSILTKLHKGESAESVQETFNNTFNNVSAIEIAGMEQEIISDDSNDITFEDVLKMCDVHANMFKGSVENAENQEDIDHPGHPVRIFKNENIALRSALLRIYNIIKALDAMDIKSDESGDLFRGLQNQVRILGQFEKHYLRKERLFFPKLEYYGNTAPPKVMWAKDDEIRDEFKEFSKAVDKLPNITIKELEEKYLTFRQVFEDMIFKEEAILINMLLETFTTEDWLQIASESDAYGYAILNKPEEKWEPSLDSYEEEASVEDPINTNEQGHFIETEDGYLTVKWEPKVVSNTAVNESTLLNFENGQLTLKQLASILDSLPLEVTFVNKDDVFQYFNNATEPENMIFKRTKAQLNRHIEMCHPPKSWPKVKQLIDDLKARRRKSESMWFEKPNGEFVHVTYIGMFDDQEKYIGILELVHDISPYRNLPISIKTDLSDID